MARIGANLAGIERTLLNRLAEANAAAALSSLRLATGSMINSPSHDPTAFLRLSGLQSRLTAVRDTMSNATAASSMISQVQSTLTEIRTQVSTIRTELLKDENRDLTSEERAEAQANIDAAIAQINTLAGTEIDGRRLLDGSANFRISGRDHTKVADLRVYSTGGSALSIHGSVTQAATEPTLDYTGKAGQASVVADATLTLTGSAGSVQLEVAEDDPLSGLVTQVNDNSHKTGVTAVLDGDVLTFTGVDYGSQAEISVVADSGTFDVTGGNGDGTANGTDAVGTINGRTLTGQGNLFTVTEDKVHYTLEAEAGFTGFFGNMTVDGPALTFALTAELADRATLAIPGVQAAKLGGLSGSLDQLASGGVLAGLDGNTSQAIRVVDEALGELTGIEGAIDGFYNASVTSASNLLSELEEDLLAEIDDVSGVDTEQETQRLLYFQDLASNAVSGLAILQQQRSNIVALIQQIAGLL